MAATRLGLHFTQEELDIWKQRMQNGPYKTAGDVSTNSPGDWDRIAANASAFLAYPDVDRWSGQTSPTCVVPYQTGIAPETNRNLGAKMRDAAFYYLLTGNTAYRDAVRDELLAQTNTNTYPGLDFSDRTRWCTHPGIGDVNPSFDIANWLTRILFAYDYIRSSLTTAQQNNLDTWFYNAGVYYEDNLVNILESRFPNRNNDDYSNPQSYSGSLPRTTHYNGHTTYEWHRAWSNRGACHYRFVTLVGVLTSNTFLKEQGKRYFKELIKYHTFPDNMQVEFYRWTTSNICMGWGYSGLELGSLLTAADVLARIGDTELYEYSTSEGYYGTKGGSKSPHNILKHYCQNVDHTVMRYATSDPAKYGDPNYLIDSIDNINNYQRTEDAQLAYANIYFQDNYIKSIYMRTAASAPAYPASPVTGGWDAWTGDWNTYPGVLFMFGQMEGMIWPYPDSSSQPTPDPPKQLRALQTQK